MRRMVVALMGVIWAVGGVPAAARGAGPDPGTAFSGVCRFAVEVAFLPPLTALPRVGRDLAVGDGTCSGDLTRAGTTSRVSQAAARYRATDASPATSCAGGVSRGGGSIILAGDTFRYALTEDRVAAGSVLRIRGAAGGEAIGVATVAPSANPSTLAQCGASGIRRVPVDVTVRTSRPLVAPSSTSSGLGITARRTPARPIAARGRARRWTPVRHDPFVHSPRPQRRRRR